MVTLGPHPQAIVSAARRLLSNSRPRQMKRHGEGPARFLVLLIEKTGQRLAFDRLGEEYGNGSLLLD